MQEQKGDVQQTAAEGLPVAPGVVIGAIVQIPTASPANSTVIEPDDGKEPDHPSVTPQDIADITEFLKRGDQESIDRQLAQHPLLAASKELFLLFVAAGEQDRAETMLKANPQLACAHGTVTDLSDRTFENITGFQYAVWALDWHMWKMIFNPEDLQHSYLTVDQAANQIEGLNQGKWVATQGIHFNFDPMFNALDAYIRNFDNWSGEKRDAYWYQQVGGALRCLPAHAINEYCRPDRSFSPTPDFKESSLVRTMKMDEGFWFATEYNGGHLGSTFGVLRGDYPWAAATGGRTYLRRGAVFGVAWDRRAVTTLQKTRHQQLDELKANLSQLKRRVSMQEANLDLQAVVVDLPAAQDAALIVEEEKTYHAPWHMDAETKARAGKVQGFKVLDAGPADIAKVFAAYQHAPVPGYSIVRVKVVYNPTLNRAFGLNLNLLEQRHSEAAFNPPWQQEKGAAAEWRRQTHQVLEDMAAPYVDLARPNLTLLPLWHTTKLEILPSLFKTGYAALSELDPGFFGAGIYSAGEAAYSYGVYSRPHQHPVLLLNWVASYSAYPVIHGDMEKLAGKGHKPKYDAHFIPVYPKTADPNEMDFYPCKPGQAYKYTELVVFEKAQCLPRYVVQLRSDADQLQGLSPAFQAVDVLSLFADAGDAGEAKDGNDGGPPKAALAPASSFGGSMNFFKALPASSQTSMGLLHIQSLLATQLKQLSVVRQSLLQDVSQQAERAIPDSQACATFISQLEKACQAAKGKPEEASALQKLAGCQKLHTALLNFERKIELIHKKLTNLEAQKAALPQAERAIIQTPAEEKALVTENTLRQRVLEFVNAMQDFLQTQKNIKWDEKAHMGFVGSVVSAIIKGPGAYNDMLDHPQTHSLTPPVANFIRSYVREHANLWELREHMDFARKLKKHLYEGELEALKPQVLASAAMASAQQPSKQAGPALEPEAKPPSNCIMS